MNKVCKNGVPEKINEYSKYCIRLYPENALLDISPEKLIGAEFCFPEREIRDRFPIQWEENPPQETTTERGVTGEIKLEEEPKIASNELSSLQEESLRGKESSDAAAKETDENMIETAPKAGITDGVSDLLEEDTPEEVSNDTEVVENGEHRTESDSNFKPEDRLSDLLEEDSSEEVSNNVKAVETRDGPIIGIIGIGIG